MGSCAPWTAPRSAERYAALMTPARRLLVLWSRTGLRRASIISLVLGLGLVAVAWSTGGCTPAGPVSDPSSPASGQPAASMSGDQGASSGSSLRDDAVTRTPDLFAPGVVSTSHYELNAALTPDGETVFFTVSPPNRRLNQYTIMTSSYRDGAWSQPEVAPFSGQYSDADPLVSPDGQRIYYISRRPHGAKPAGRPGLRSVLRRASPGQPGMEPAASARTGDQHRQG